MELMTRRAGEESGGNIEARVLMNSRERVMKALSFQEPDRVPIVMGGMGSSIHVWAQRRLKAYLELEGGEEVIYDRMQLLAYVDPRIEERYELDVAPVFAIPGSGTAMPVEEMPDRWTDEFGITYYRPPGGYWFDPVDYPLKEGTIAELMRYEWPDPCDSAITDELVEKVEHLYYKTDKAIQMNPPLPGTLELGWFLRGMENSMMDLAANLNYAEALIDACVEWLLAAWERIIDLVGPYVQVMCYSDDMGGQDGLLISPEMFRGVFKPRLRRLMDFLHSSMDAKVLLHSDGAIREVIPDYIECGVDALNPVQVSAEGMDSAGLKRDFGRDIAFWGGGCDSQTVLPFVTPEEVREEVRRRMEDFKPGGGYVFGPIHHIESHVPPENIDALFRAAVEFGSYN